ncbi:helix-turn-helix transcriptional regulator [Williamsia muralis]|uniref:Helix-turn-helix domain-containing protein n=1 Tax=Williamsia marianensis TaxID=85044 RepID=A0ABU4F2R8_WILMA|nr:helix-turn-helix domain-containing protein [Williamsia muralis]MDV7137204.1 helix-turn-helix domain-containing protein [Williamsia muralis]
MNRDSLVPPLVFVQMLESQALDPDAIARLRAIMTRAGADEATLLERDIPAPLQWFRQVYPELDIDQATLLGFAFAEQARLTSFGALSIPLVSAGSITEVVELLTYLPLISTALRPQLHPGDHGLTVGLTAYTGDRALDCLTVTYSGATLLRLLDMLVGDAPTVTLHMNWPAPTALATHEKDLAVSGRLHFDAPMSYLYVPADTLDEVCRFSDPLAYRLAVADLKRTLDQRSGDVSFSEKVRQLLEKDPRQPHSQWVADELAVSTSTLKRRLSAEGTTFRELRESCLRENAMLMLLTRSMSASQIATELGYSDLTSFSHAFKRWTGHSPSEFLHSRP